MTGRTIFITGAASGIGRETALLFARRGWRVGAFDINAEALEQLERELEEDRCFTGTLDVTNVEQFSEAVQSFGQWSGGRMDVLFNNAGILQQGLFEAISLEDHIRTIDVNLRGVVIGIHAALPLLKNTRDACILSMSSASALLGTPDHSVYSATKFGVRALTEALSVELAGDGIRVVDLMPAFVGTPMVHDQLNPSPFVEQMGVSHEARDIAEWAYRAVRGKKIHWMTPQVKLTDVLVTLLPSVALRWMGRTLARTTR